MDSVKESDIPWMEENFPSLSTSVPEIVEESNEIGTVVIFVVSAILTITLLFVVAVFIDCRHQKLTQLIIVERKPKKTLHRKLPSIAIGRSVRQEDEASFAHQMEDPESIPPSVIV